MLRRLARRSLPQVDGRLRLACLDEPVEVVRDRYGIPHVYARSRLDLVRAPELLAELVERVAPAANRLGSTALLAPLDGLAQAADQLAHGRRDGLPSLCAELVAST